MQHVYQQFRDAVAGDYYQDQGDEHHVDVKYPMHKFMHGILSPRVNISFFNLKYGEVGYDS